MEPAVEEEKWRARWSIFACPVCFSPVAWKGDPSLSLESATAHSTLECKSCDKSFSSQGSGSHLDMLGKAVKAAASSQFFTMPVMSFLYERGWRQSFSLLWGFPGPHKEFEMMKEHLKPATGGSILDASCGSGLFSRLFAKSKLFSMVVALDFSEAMLQQCHGFIKKDKSFPESNIILVRADISRLPFGSSTLDAVHAGAALHCWPSPSSAVAEISRVLKPGGVFVATTFILDWPPFSYRPLRSSLKQKGERLSGYQLFKFFRSEKELEELCARCGLVNFKCRRNRRFVMIAAVKPL